MVRPSYTNIIQAGVIVDDVEKAVKAYADVYGMGPWYIYNVDSTVGKNMAVRGKVVGWGGKIARGVIGNVEIELIEPIDDKSIHYEYLKKYGPGIHHLMFTTDDFDRTVEWMKERGIEMVSSGELPGGIRFAYFATEDELGYVSEYAYFPPDAQWDPDSVYPAQK